MTKNCRVSVFPKLHSVVNQHSVSSSRTLQLKCVAPELQIYKCIDQRNPPPTTFSLSITYLYFFVKRLVLHPIHTLKFQDCPFIHIFLII